MNNTNWSTPKTNFFAAIEDLHAALSSGHNARLIRMRNEDCNYPIKKSDDPKKFDFRNYSFSMGYPATYNKVLNTGKENVELTLNYVSCYGTPEAIEKYYKTGVVTSGNIQGMGTNHLVKVDDMIKYLQQQPAKDIWAHGRATSLYAQYRDPDTRDESFMFDFFTPAKKSTWNIVKFKNELWVVELLDGIEDEIVQPIGIRISLAIMNYLLFPTKFIPKKDVLKMKDYKVITFRVGSVTNGWSIQFHVPKKFSFK